MLYLTFIPDIYIIYLKILGFIGGYMRRINTADLVPGMVTAEDVYNYTNQLILPRGIILTDTTITKLAFYSIIAVRVEDELASQAPQTDDYTMSYSDRIKKSPEFIKFKREFENDVESFRSVINDVVEKGSPLDVNRLMNHTLNILDLGSTTPNIFDMLHCMREYDDATYIHSMNVALICNIFARWLRMNEEEIIKATTSGLLHDIGKIKIPEEILKKPDKLTKQEFNIIKRHPQEGYRLLLDSKLDPEVLNAVLMHHERCDGTGYPLNLSANQIGIYAKMVSIADVYDATTSARVYRGPLCPFSAISIFEQEGLRKYDPKFVMTFLENVVNTYLLNDVRLNNGTTGTVVFINKNKLSAPTIQTSSGFVNLSTQSELEIESLI